MANYSQTCCFGETVLVCMRFSIIAFHCRTCTRPCYLVPCSHRVACGSWFGRILRCPASHGCRSPNALNCQITISLTLTLTGLKPSGFLIHARVTLRRVRFLFFLTVFFLFFNLFRLFFSGAAFCTCSVGYVYVSLHSHLWRKEGET